MDIRRDIIADFKQWKDSPQRKPILLQGARQIGKTWVMEAFGKECFEQYARFDFDRQPELKSVFQVSKSPERIIKELALYCDVPLIAGKTLLIFDEIQECEEALNSLKYFCEEAPQYHIIAAGSLLGVAVKRRRMTVPVGKVRVMRMYPVSFREFLRASDEQTFEYVEGIESPTHLPEIILNKLKLEYRRYMICGGMPEAVVAMLNNQGMQSVDDVLQGILDLYELDFAKYAEPREIPRIRAIWHSLPSQLGKENRKFIFKVIKTGARSKDYEDSLLWLEDAGMIYRINNVSKPGMPLKAYEEPDAFKVYVCDCGLLRQLAHLPASTIMDSSSNYTEFKGAMAENAVLQSLMPMMNNQMPNYWSPDSKAQEEAAFRKKAANYLVCFIDRCPQHEECLRWQVGHYVNTAPLAQLAVNPRHAEVATEQCPLFRTKERVSLKRGLTQMYVDMPSRIEHAVRQQLYQEFGRKYYFEMRNGSRPITPDQQQVILETCRRYGWQGPVVYDSEEEGFAW